MDFDGKVAIVTGGSTGLGETIAEELFKRGARVVIAPYRQARLCM